MLVRFTLPVAIHTLSGCGNVGRNILRNDRPKGVDISVSMFDMSNTRNFGIPEGADQRHRVCPSGKHEQRLL